MLTIKFGNFLKKNYLILLILIAGFFLRIYKAPQLFYYGHDQDLAGWFVRDVVDNGHLRLIGQETSTQGIFIGPLYYYLLVPFYLVLNMDPLGGVALVTILGIITILSIYFVFSKVFGKNSGYVGAFLYAVSFYTVFNDREVVPTMPVILWTVWFLYVLYLVLSGRQKKGFVLAGILIGLIWNLNFALVLTVPLIAVGIYLSQRKLNIKHILTGGIIFLLTITPLVMFEVKHGFIQSKSLIAALTSPQHDIISGWEKFNRVIDLAAKDAVGLIWGDIQGVGYVWEVGVLLLIFLYSAFKKILTKNWVILFSMWLVVYILFFSLYSKIVSEYYLNGMMIVWISVLSVFISYFISLKKYRILGLFFLLMFFLVNNYRFLTYRVEKNGYLYRKAIVKEINADAQRNNYPCVAVSYITNPGYNLGYRYFYYLEDLHVNRPDSGSPVYTIVYPLNDILFPVHKTFGVIGLIYPDYGKYKPEKVTISCSGANSNLTDPMWGFTQ